MNYIVILVLLTTYCAVRYTYWRVFECHKDACADGYYTLLAKRKFKKEGLKRFKHMPGIMLDYPMIYPPIGLLIAHVIPEWFMRKYFGLINSVLDLFYFILLLSLALFMSSSSVSIFCMGIGFIFLPTIFGLNQTNAIHFNLSWRDLGRLSATMFFLVNFIMYLAPNWELKLILFGLLTIIGIFNFYASQFALQCVVFGALVISIISLDPLPIVSLVIGNALIFALDNSWFLKYYGHKVKHFSIYFKSVKKHHNQASGKYAFSLSHIRKAISAFFKGDLKEARTIIKQDPALRGFYLFIPQIPVVVLLVEGWNPLNKAIVLWYATAVILWFVTSNKSLKIFGEPDRYLEFFGYFPILLGVGTLLSGYKYEDFRFWIVAGSILLLPLYNLKKFITILKMFGYPIYGAFTGTKGYPFGRVRELVEFDNQRWKCKNVLPYTFSFAWKIAYQFKAEVLYPPILKDAEKTAWISNYPNPNWTNLSAILLEYEINYIIAVDRFLDNKSRKKIENCSKEKEVFGEYVIYKVG